MKVFITKYWETAGILEKEAKICNDSMIKVFSPETPLTPYFHKPYWHETKEEAIAHAESLRGKKIASSKKLISKLEKMSFS